LDSIPHLLGVLNGVVDLRTGAVRPREPEDCIFTVLNMVYDPEAPVACIDEIVSSIMADDEAKMRFLQKLLGYGITGEVSEEIFAVFTGSGRNGKGVLLQIVQYLLGDHFFKVANNGIITHRKTSNIDAERGVLLGARIVNFKELEAGERLKTSEVQLLTGGDGIPARPLYHDPMVIQPRFLLILETNHMPVMDPVIPASVERTVILDFKVTFTDLLPGEEPSQFRRQTDKDLKAKLKGPLAASFLRWLVMGAVSWYANKGLKLNAPADVVEFTRQYFEEQDTFLQFLTSRCEAGPNHQATSAELLDAYNEWVGCGEKHLTSKQLTPLMSIKGFLKKNTRIGGGPPIMCFHGIRLLPLMHPAVFDDDSEGLEP
jgi:putative DNA primase/helicase